MPNPVPPDCQNLLDQVNKLLQQIIALQNANSGSAGGNKGIIQEIAALGRQLAPLQRQLAQCLGSTGPVLNPGPPAVLLEIGINLAGDEAFQQFVQEKIQEAEQPLASLSGFLASAAGPVTDFGPPAHDAVFGPQIQNTQDELGNPVLRIGLWILGYTFPFNDAAAQLGWNDAPPPAPLVSPGNGFAFRLTIPVATLNQLLTDITPWLQAQVSAKTDGIATLQSASVTCAKPNLATATFSGQAGFPSVGISGTIAQTLGTVPAVDPCSGSTITNPVTSSPTAVPTVTSSVTTSGINLTDVLVTQLVGTLIDPVFLLEVPLIASGTSLAMFLGGAYLAVSLLRLTVPATISLSSGQFDGFQQLVFNWVSVGADSTSIIGNGTVSLPTARTSSCIKITGPSSVNVGSAVSPQYGLTWFGILPDEAQWTLTPISSGIAATSGTVSVSADSGGAILAPTVSTPTKHGLFLCTLTVTATENDASGNLPPLRVSSSKQVTVVNQVVKHGK